MTRDDLVALWTDPAHWNRDGTYKCASDPRLWVQKRWGGGWTINMEHAKGPLTFWAFSLGIVAVVIGVLALAPGGPVIAELAAAAFALLIGGIVAVEQFLKWWADRSNRGGR
jgi:hypothetical protein